MWADRVIAEIDAKTGFDGWGPDANPLIARALRREGRNGRHLSLRACVWLAFGLGLAGLAFSTWHVMRVTANVGRADGLILIFGWLFHLVMPFIMAITSAMLTLRTLHAEDFDMIRITPVSGPTLVRAFVFTALYRMRYAFVALIGLTPFLVVETFYLIIGFQTIVIYYTSVVPTYWEIVSPTLFALALLTGTWGINILAAAIGVQTAITRRSLGMAALAAPASIFMFMACPAVLCLTITPAIPTDSDFVALCLIVGVLLGIVFGPYVVAFSVMHTTADRWRR